MIMDYSFLERVEEFMVNLGTAARGLPKIEEDIAHEKELVKEIFVPEVPEPAKAKRRANSKEINELIETIIRLKKLFKQIEKKEGKSQAAKKVKLKLDLLHSRLVALEKKKKK